MDSAEDQPTYAAMAMATYALLMTLLKRLELKQIITFDDILEMVSVIKAEHKKMGAEAPDIPGYRAFLERTLEALQDARPPAT